MHNESDNLLVQCESRHDLEASGNAPLVEFDKGLRSVTLRLAAALMGLASLGLGAMALSHAASAETLNEALASAYHYNPRLDAERARQRATDEEVPRAMSGYRPQIEANADVGRQVTNVRPDTVTEGLTSPRGFSIQAVQPVFNGFQTTYGVRGAEASVRAGREQLRDVEQQVLLDAVTAYMDVLRDQSVLQAREKNVRVLSKELEATRERFAVGEVTKTDVAQVEARRAGAVSALELAKANLQSRRAIYERVMGHPPQSLTSPKGYEALIPNSVDEALSLAGAQHPIIVSALYQEEAARHAVDRIRGELLPELSVEASYSDRFSTNKIIDETETGVVAGRLRVPLYEGGEVHARVRQAKHTHIQRLQQIEQARTEVLQQVTSGWSQLIGAKGQLESDMTQVRANQTALEGVREEERVGQRTVLDVLDAELELVNAEVQASTTRRNVVVAAYSLLSAMGKLEVAQIGVSDPVYDAEAHYNEVRNKWWGISITDAEGHTTSVAEPAGEMPVK